jgi:hypothetical protein
MQIPVDENVKYPRTIDWPYVIGLLLLPFLILGVFLLVAWIDGWVRYDPAYFTSDYLKRYSTRDQLLTDLESAIRSGDPTLLAESQGTRPSSTKLEPLPNVHLMIFWDGDQKYINYLFMDTRNYQRYMQHVRSVRGRFVRVPDGLFFLADSGQWKLSFGPILVVWYILVILFTLGTWIYRSMAIYRHRVFGRPPGT